jgi:hypothetical protein
MPTTSWACSRNKRQAQGSTGRHRRGALRRFRRDTRGFAAAEAVLLALILSGTCLVVGHILFKGALIAAKALNTELTGH